MSFETLATNMLPEIDRQLHKSVEIDLIDKFPGFLEIIGYQLGWNGDQSGIKAQGKRIRPLLVLLSAHAAGADWRNALPAAAAVELLHNFSLIHDDIQDKSTLRRGRETVWVKWGEAQAINAGDAMLGLADLAMMPLIASYKAETVVSAQKLFHHTLVELTRGQYLDLAFEKAENLPLDDYFIMINGKTAALLACCLELGAILGGADQDNCQKMAEYGRLVGKAFQIQDDWLGVWGDSEVTGKSANSDLIEQKKSYPILAGIHTRGKFYENWIKQKKVDPQMAEKLADLLARDGIKEKTEQEFAKYYSNALALFAEIKFSEEKKKPLGELVTSLLIRKF